MNSDTVHYSAKEISTQIVTNKTIRPSSKKNHISFLTLYGTNKFVHLLLISTIAYSNAKVSTYFIQLLCVYATKIW